jgi:hypothetical protein
MTGNHLPPADVVEPNALASLLNFSQRILGHGYVLLAVRGGTELIPGELQRSFAALRMTATAIGMTATALGMAAAVVRLIANGSE